MKQQIRNTTTTFVEEDTLTMQMESRERVIHFNHLKKVDCKLTGYLCYY
jgi:hypothetical protein